MASIEFLNEKIRTDGAEKAAAYADAAQQRFIAKMIRAGFTDLKYSRVAISAINEIFKVEGPDAAARFADLEPTYAWAAKKIRSGSWDPDRKKGSSTTEPEGPAKMEPPYPRFLGPRPARNGKTARARESGAHACYLKNKTKRADDNRDRAKSTGSGQGKKREEKN